MAEQETDIVRVFHHREPVVRDAIENCAKRHTEHSERESRARLESMLHRLSDEMTERARAERAGLKISTGTSPEQ